MPELIALIATTAVVKQGGTRIKLAKEALECFVTQANSEKALPFIVEHDPRSVPLGKVKEVWIEAFGREYAAKARVHIEDTARSFRHLRSNTELVYLNFSDDPRPFVRISEDSGLHSITVGVDRANFNTREAYSAFMSDIKRLDDNILSKEIGRRSLGPEPLVQFVLSNADLGAALAVGLWILHRVEKFVRYTVDETLRKSADAISDALSARIAAIVDIYYGRQARDDRSVTIETIIRGTMDIVLVTRLKRGSKFPAIELKEIAKELEKYGDVLAEAEEVTMSREGRGDWKLEHAKMRTGQVLGTRDCYDRTIGRLAARASSDTSEHN